MIFRDLCFFADIIFEHLIMSDQHDRMSHIIELDKEVSYFASLIWIEISGRFVRDDVFWSMDDSSGDSDQLLFSSRKFTRDDVSLRSESYRLDCIVDGLLFEIDRHAYQTKRKRNIFSDSLSWYELVILKYNSDLASECLYFGSTKSRHIFLSMIEHLFGYRMMSCHKFGKSSLSCSWFASHDTEVMFVESEIKLKKYHRRWSWISSCQIFGVHEEIMWLASSGFHNIRFVRL